MAVVENAAVNGVGPSNRIESNVVVEQSNHLTNGNGSPIARSNDQSFHMIVNQPQQQKITPPPAPAPAPAAPAPPSGQINGSADNGNHKTTPAAAAQVARIQQHSINGNGNGVSKYHHHHQIVNGSDDDGGEGFKQEMRDLEEMLSKLNPMAEEFVPPSIANHRPLLQPAGPFGYTPNNFVVHTNPGFSNGNSARRKKSNYGNGKRRMNSRTSMAQRDDVIRRTVYVSDIDHQVTEEQLAALFINCGQVVDCRVCGDPNSVLRFAFVEFTDEEGARNALSLAGTMLGYYPVRVLPSKTAIAPVNPTFLPRSEDEREMCARTIYCTNIDKKVTQADVKLFFESFCGEVYRLRLLGDYHHSTRIAFVEFVMAESAIAALNCSGAVLGSLPIRIQRYCKGNSSCGKAAAWGKDKKAAKTLKADDVKKLTTPMLVKDLLTTDFSCSGVGLSKKPMSKQHPCSSQLKLANTYNSVSAQSFSSPSVMSGEVAHRVKRRIKVVITKQQLQELLSKQVVLSLGDLLSDSGSQSKPS